MILAERLNGHDDRDLYDQLVSASKSPSTLANTRRAVFNRYDEYEQQWGFCSKSSWCGGEKAALEGNWSALTNAQFNDLRPRILSLTAGICYLCGNSKAGELDHYLPKSKFPEFCAFSLNLLPACHRCNNKKRARYKIGNQRLYFHPYFMSLPENSRFLGVSVNVGDTVEVSYFIDDHAGIDDETCRVLNDHFEDLDIASIYRDEAISYLVDQRDAYYLQFQAGGEKLVADELQRQLHTFRNARGPNHWRSVLVAELAASEEFCQGGFKALGPYVPMDL